MNDQPSAVSGALKRPFAEQVAYWRAKLGNLVPTERWSDMLGAAHDTGWMVAGAQQADLLVDLAAAIDRGVSEGRTLDDYRRDFAEIVAQRGWSGWTGQGTEAGERWRTRVTYQTNMATSYAAGREAQLQAGGFAYAIYKHSKLSADPRPQHLGWDGMALPVDHPFWATHSPPNGYGCQCYKLGARSAAGVARLGGRLEDAPPEGWDQRDAKGLLAGVGQGWDYAPGAARAVNLAAAKAASYPSDLARAYMGSIPAARRDELARAYRSLPTVARDTRLYAQRIQEGRTYLDIPPSHTLGLVTGAQRAQLADLLGVEVADLADWALDRETVAALGADLPPDAYRALPGLLNSGTIEAAGAGGRVRVVAADGGSAYEWALRDGRLLLAGLS